MNPSKQILVVEIKTIDSAEFDTQQLSGGQHSREAHELRPQKMIIYRNSRNRYFLFTGIEKIRTAILDAIPRFGSNYHHPLLFDVQILPGNEMDAYMASIDEVRSQVQDRRRK